MTYDLTLLSNASNFFDVVLFSQSVTNNLFIPLAMMALFFIMTLSLLRYGLPRALITSCFLCFVLSTILSYIGLFPVYYVLVFLVGAICVGLWMQFHPYD